MFVDWVQDNFIVILLALFGGVLFWAFRPKKRKRIQAGIDQSSIRNED